MATIATFTLTMTDWDIGCVHDTILDAINEDWDDDQIVEWCKKLPNAIKYVALMWGWDDIEVRDQIYRHTEKELG